MSEEETAQEWDSNVAARAADLENKKDNIFWYLIVPIFQSLVRGKSFKEVVDIGCGPGFLTSELAHIVGHIVGIDISAESVHYANAHFTSCFINESLETFTAHCSPGTKDACIAHMSLHYFVDINLAFRNIQTLLQPGGSFIFSVPHPAFWFQKHTKDFWYPHEKVYALPFKTKDCAELKSLITIQHRTLETYSRALSENGFVIEQMLEPSFGNEYKGMLIFVCKRV